MNEMAHMLSYAVGAALVTGALTFPVTMPGAVFDGRSQSIDFFEFATDQTDPIGEEGGDVCILLDPEHRTGSYAAPLQVPGLPEDYRPATGDDRRACSAPFGSD